MGDCFLDQRLRSTKRGLKSLLVEGLVQTTGNWGAFVRDNHSVRGFKWDLARALNKFLGRAQLHISTFGSSQRSRLRPFHFLGLKRIQKSHEIAGFHILTQMSRCMGHVDWFNPWLMTSKQSFWASRRWQRSGRLLFWSLFRQRPLSGA